MYPTQPCWNYVSHFSAPPSITLAPDLNSHSSGSSTLLVPRWLVRTFIAKEQHCSSQPRFCRMILLEYMGLDINLNPIPMFWQRPPRGNSCPLISLTVVTVFHQRMVGTVATQLHAELRQPDLRYAPDYRKVRQRLGTCCADFQTHTPLLPSSSTHTPKLPSSSTHTPKLPSSSATARIISALKRACDSIFFTRFLHTLTTASCALYVRSTLPLATQ
jgi:hypothetical protein